MSNCVGPGCEHPSHKLNEEVPVLDHASHEAVIQMIRDQNAIIENKWIAEDAMQSGRENALTRKRQLRNRNKAMRRKGVRGY